MVFGLGLKYMFNLIVIKGRPNTGKTTLANELVDILPDSTHISTDWILVKMIRNGVVAVDSQQDYGNMLKTFLLGMSPAAKKAMIDALRLELSFATENYTNVITEGVLWMYPEYQDILSKYENICYVVTDKDPLRMNIHINDKFREILCKTNWAKEVLQMIREDTIDRIISEYGWYQRYDFLSHSTSDSNGKLNALKLPQDMSGCNVFDVGCNTGLFSFECERRGAHGIVGIDSIPLIIDTVNKIKTSIYFSHETNFYLMDVNDDIEKLGKFSYILVLGFIHYFHNQEELINKFIDMLKPNGVLKLEIGIHPGEENHSVITPKGKCYPTMAKLRDMFKKYVYEINPSVDQKGDRFPRSIVTVRRGRYDK